jgi:hypothetical protein
MPEVETPVVETPTETPDWRAGLPPELAGDKSLASYKDLPSLAKSHVELQKMVGGSFRLPAKDAKPEEVNAVRAKLIEAGFIDATPESPDKYDLKVPDAVKMDEKITSGFKAKAHKLGMSTAKAQELLDWYGEHVGGVYSQMDVDAAKAKVELEKELGPEGLKRSLGLAHAAARELGGEPFLAYLDASGLGSHPTMVKVMARVGAILAEDKVIDGEIAGTMTPAEAKRKIAEIQNTPTHPYFNRRAAGHDEAVQEMAGLHKLAFEVG